MIWLLDGNVLAALVIDTHADHARATRWFTSLTERFATCSVTQGTLLRLHMRFAADKSARAAWQALAGVEAHPLHEYWNDDLPYRLVPHEHTLGHRQVTDAWLIALAQHRKGGVATLDKGMADAYPKTAVPL